MTRDLTARWLAALLLGLPASLSVLGVVALAWPGPQAITALPWTLMLFPLWITAMALAFAARSGTRAWAWLGSVTVLALALLYGGKALGWLAVQA